MLFYSRRCLAVQIAPPATHPELARYDVGGKEAGRFCHVYFRDADTGHGQYEVALGKAVFCLRLPRVSFTFDELHDHRCEDELHGKIHHAAGNDNAVGA